MTFQQLHYILEVYRTGSISRAAENLFVTRPGVSLSLRNLEAELGYPIFVRTQNGLIPSPQGELVLEYASRICETQDLINGIGQNRRNRIEIASVEYAPVQNAALRLLQENRHRRDVSFSFKSSYSDPFKKLAFFELDAVVSKRFATQNASVEEQLTRRNLAWKELHQIPVVIVIGPGHRLYREKVLQPKDFDHDVLLETPTSALGRCGFLRDQSCKPEKRNAGPGAWVQHSKNALGGDDPALRFPLHPPGGGVSAADRCHQSHAPPKAGDHPFPGAFG